MSIIQPTCAVLTGAVELSGLPKTGSWTINPGGITGTGVSTRIDAISPGTYQFTVTDAQGCISLASEIARLKEPDKLLLTVERSISVDGNYNISCAGAATGYINVEAINNTGNTNYIWNDGFVGNKRTNLTAGTYQVAITDANSCVVEESVTLTEPDPIKLTFDIKEPLCAEQATGEIHLTSTGGVSGGDYMYLWNNNSTTRDLLNISAGTYSVSVTDMNECTANGTVTLNGLNSYCLVIPEAISPNNDLINDVWNMQNTDLYPEMKVTIYNRWGQVVWVSQPGYPVPWDGRSDGEQLPVDSYHYVIELHNGLRAIVGTITIIR